MNRLQQYAAELTGKEAALFVPSGTMANLIAVLAQCGRGGEVRPTDHIANNFARSSALTQNAYSTSSSVG